MKIAKINIEGYIGGNDVQAMFSGEETFNLSKLKKHLDNLESDVTDLHVYVNSGGGSILEGWAIYDKLKTCGLNVTTIGEGIVGSIATIIYMAGTTRRLHENTKFFIHNPYWMPNEPTPMESNDLIALGEDLKNEQKKILDFYSEVTGTSIDSIEPLMNKATDLTATQAVEMGFAQSIINEFVNQHRYQLVALINKPKKEKQMEENKQVLSAIDKLTNLFAKVFKKQMLAMAIKAKDASGAEVTLNIDSEDDNIVGKPAIAVDAEGVEIQTGEFTDESGKVIKIENGLVAEVSKVDDEVNPMDALKAELEAQKALNAELTTSFENLKTEKETIQNSMLEINKEFVALKKTIIGSGAKFETGNTQNFSNSKPIEKNEFLESIANSIKSKKK